MFRVRGGRRRKRVPKNFPVLKIRAGRLRRNNKQRRRDYSEK